MSVYVEKNKTDSFIRIMNSFKRNFVDFVHIESQTRRELAAEFIGTAFIMALGIGCSCTNTLSRGTFGNIVSQDLGWGLTVAFAVILTGGVSGGHLNPSISITFALLGQLSWIKVPMYIICQILGAIFGSALAFGIYFDAFHNYDGGVRMVYGANATANLFATYPQDFLSTGSGFANEVFATSILMICVMAIVDKKNVNIPPFLMPLFVGLTILLINCSLCYNSGCAMNPARDFGPRLFTCVAGWGVDVFTYRNYNWFWVPILGPICGAPIGAFGYNLFVGFHHKIDEKEEKPLLQSQPSVGTILYEGKNIFRSASMISENDLYPSK